MAQSRRAQVHGNYVSLSAKPLFPFGHGLSYTRFAFDGLHKANRASATGRCNS